MSGHGRRLKWVVGAMAVWTFGLGGALVAVHGAWASKVDATVPGPTTTATVVTTVSHDFTEGVPGTITIGTTHNPACTGTIDWGDGTSSATSLAPTGGGGFAINGTHTYAEEAAFYFVSAVSQTASDCSFQSGITSVTTATSTQTIGGIVFVSTLITVSETDIHDKSNCCEPLAVTANAITATAGSAFTGTVATFTDPDPAIPVTSTVQENDSPAVGPPSSYTATINWGDTTSSTGAVASDGAGGFTVTGTHTYPSAGSLPLSVSVTDTDNSTGTGSATATVNGNCGRTFTIGSVQFSLKVGPGQFLCLSVAKPPNSIVITAPPPSVKTTFGGITLVLPPQPVQATLAKPTTKPLMLGTPVTLGPALPVTDTITKDASAIVAPRSASLGLCPASQLPADTVFPDLVAMIFATNPSSAGASQLQDWSRCK